MEGRTFDVPAPVAAVEAALPEALARAASGPGHRTAGAALIVTAGGEELTVGFALHDLVVPLEGVAEMSATTQHTKVEATVASGGRFRPRRRSPEPPEVSAAVRSVRAALQEATRGDHPVRYHWQFIGPHLGAREAALLDFAFAGLPFTWDGDSSLSRGADPVGTLIIHDSVGGYGVHRTAIDLDLAGATREEAVRMRWAAGSWSRGRALSDGTLAGAAASGQKKRAPLETRDAPRGGVSLGDT